MRKVISLLIALGIVIGLIIWTKQKKPFDDLLKDAPVETEDSKRTPTPTVTAITTIIPEQSPTPEISSTPIPENTEAPPITDIKKEKWYPKLHSDLLKFMPKGTRVIMESIQTTTKKDKNLEVLQITYIKPIGARSNFKAILNTETGMIIKTWDQTQVEPIKKEPRVFSPSGSVK